MTGPEAPSPNSDNLERALHDPAVPLLARLDAARQIIRMLDEARAAALRTATDIVQRQKLDDDTIAAIYWSYDDLVKTTVIGQIHEIRHIIEPRCPWTYPCPGCGADQPVSSRTRLRQLQSAFANPKANEWRIPPCADCKRARDAAREGEWRARTEAHQQRLHELKTMRYRDYLLTPEWRERRLARLKAARYRCQVCNTKDVRLNVHHRTYVRRGEELTRDLIVLCESCHHLIHQNGSLAPHSLEDEDEWFSPVHPTATPSVARVPRQQPGTCKYCRRPIQWAALNGRHRTFDPDPLPVGDVPAASAFIYSAKHGAMVRADRMSPQPETVTRIHTCAEYSEALGKTATLKEIP